MSQKGSQKTKTTSQLNVAMMNSSLFKNTTTATAVVVRETLSVLLKGGRSSSSRIINNSLQQQRTFAKGSKGSRGHGWLHHYRAGNKGRHLQGKFHYRNVDERNQVNEEVFAFGTKEVFLDLKVILNNNNNKTEIETETESEGDPTSETKRIILELASTALPQTCENFIKLIEDGYYLNTNIYKIEKNVGICLGDILHRDGRGGKCHPSISNTGYFNHESYVLSHTTPGMVTMLSPGVHRNNSKFCITTNDCPQLDGRFSAFARIKQQTDGYNHILDIINSVHTKKGRPNTEIQIVGAGIL